MLEVIHIAGAGLAGVSLAWSLFFRQQNFLLYDDGISGSSHVAAGLMSPISGKNCTVTWRYDSYFPQAKSFYQRVEKLLGIKIFHEHEHLWLVAHEHEKKMRRKFSDGEAADWKLREADISSWQGKWAAGFFLKDGARLDVATYLEKSKNFFRERNLLLEEKFVRKNPQQNVVLCQGASGLVKNFPRYWRPRCAKGEMLTIRTDADENQVLQGAGWMIPVGNGLFKVGASYVWDTDECEISDDGLQQVKLMAEKFCVKDFEIVNHEAGLRPIVRMSTPVIGEWDGSGEMVFNGLGSKGSLMAPIAAEHLADLICENIPVPKEFCAKEYFSGL